MLVAWNRTDRSLHGGGVASRVVCPLPLERMLRLVAVSPRSHTRALCDHDLCTLTKTSLLTTPCRAGAEHLSPMAIGVVGCSSAGLLNRLSRLPTRVFAQPVFGVVHKPLFAPKRCRSALYEQKNRRAPCRS